MSCVIFIGLCTSCYLKNIFFIHLIDGMGNAPNILCPDVKNKKSLILFYIFFQAFQNYARLHQ